MNFSVIDGFILSGSPSISDGSLNNLPPIKDSNDFEQQRQILENTLQPYLKR